MPANAKICGLSTTGTLDAACRYGASHVGLNLYPPSPRHVDFARLRELTARLPSHVASVGVFVNPDDALIDGAMAAGDLAVLQLHETTPARAAEIGARTQRDIWAVVAVRARADLDAAQGFRGAASRILYDAKTPKGAALPGGMGLRFDWSLLDGFRHPLPWALSGGLDADNVGEAIARTGATLVDVSSGVETAPGVKDMDRIAAFLQAVRS